MGGVAARPLHPYEARLTVRLQWRRPQHVGSKFTGASQRSAVLRYAQGAFPLERQVADTCGSEQLCYLFINSPSLLHWRLLSPKLTEDTSDS